MEPKIYQPHNSNTESEPAPPPSVRKEPASRLAQTLLLIIAAVLLVAAIGLYFYLNNRAS